VVFVAVPVEKCSAKTVGFTVVKNLDAIDALKPAGKKDD
jgi:hypothetical protein